MNRLAYIDGLRGLFALMVALYHFNKKEFFMGGYLAVDFFFVLSGFILAYVYLPRIERLTLTKFIGSRLSRLWPLHFFTMFLFVAFYSISQYLIHGKFDLFPEWKGESTIATFFENVFLLQNLGFQNGMAWNYPSWSISVEFWVNIVLFFVLARLALKPKNQTALLGLLTLVVLTCYVILEEKLKSLTGTRAHTGQAAIILNAGLLRGFGGIFLGVLVYKLVMAIDPKRERWSSKIWGIIKSVTEIALLATIFYIISIDGVNSDSDFTAIFIFAILLALLSIGQLSLLRSVLSLWPFTFLGLISYSIYLGHMPLLQFFRNWKQIVGKGWDTNIVATIFVVSTITLAAALYYCVEKPGQRVFRKIWDKILPHDKETLNLK